MCFKQQSDNWLFLILKENLQYNLEVFAKFSNFIDSIFSVLCAQNLFSQLKSAPSDSLTYRLALCLCLVNYNYGGLRAVAHVWQEFVLELRYRWENNYLIFG